MGIIAGAGASSTRETIEFAKEAAEAGADQVIVIPPGYFAGAIKEDAFAGVKK
jgi:4-hydroxy-2-oxoglutarate aldolase